MDIQVSNLMHRLSITSPSRGRQNSPERGVVVVKFPRVSSLILHSAVGLRCGSAAVSCGFRGVLQKNRMVVPTVVFSSLEYHLHLYNLLTRILYRNAPESGPRGRSNVPQYFYLVDAVTCAQVLFAYVFFLLPN